MTHRLLVLYLSIFFWVFTASSLNTNVSASEVIVVEGHGVAFPESVVHDEVADLYLVSNFGSFPPATSNPGFISRIDPDGNVVDVDWIDGLIQPKGLAINNDTLYIADVNAIRVYEIDRQDDVAILKYTWHVPFEENKNWLNDVAVGPNGVVYASDSGFGLEFGKCPTNPYCQDPPCPCPNEKGALYKFDGKEEDGFCTLDGTGICKVISQGASLDGPNGITVKGHNLFVASFFWNDIYRTNPSGKLFNEAVTPGFSLDGLVRLKKNALLVSSWSPPAIYMIDASRKTVSTILDENSGYFMDTGTTNPLFNEAPADIGFDHTRNKILIPVMQGNRLVIYSMTSGKSDRNTQTDVPL